MNKRYRPAMRVWVVLNADGVPMSVIAPRNAETRETLERHWCRQIELFGYYLREGWLKVGTQ